MTSTATGRRVVITGMGAVTPLGNDVADVLVAARGRRVGRPHHQRLRPRAGRPARSPARSSTSTRRRARPQGDPAQRPHDAVRARRHARGDGPGRPAGAAGGRRWPRRPASSSAPASAARARSSTRSAINADARPGSPQPVLHPHGHRQHGGRPGGHRVRRAGPQLRDRQRLRHGRPRHRRGDRDDPARRRRR